MSYLKLVCLLCVAMGAEAQVYKCRDSEDRIAYSQQPCPAQSERLEMRDPALSVVESGAGARVDRYRKELRSWSEQRAKRLEQDKKAERRERDNGSRKWQAEKAHCQGLADKRKALRDSMRIGMTPAQLQTAQSRLVKVEDQMQDRACHLYKDE